MKRNIYTKLLDWKNKDDKKPLLITGKRQVGKTYIIKKFANNEYDDFIYINFMENSSFADIFKGHLNPLDVFKNISIFFNKEIKDKTLILFDEVQECPEALNFLKFLNESNFANNLIATGSWIDVSLLKQKITFPVGMVEMLNMYPMTIDEFIIAIYGNQLLKAIYTSFEKKQPLNNSIHNKLLGVYNEYLSIGGMPEIVNFYKNNLNNLKVYENINNKLNDLSNGYISDLSKYTNNINIIKLNQIYDSLASNLNRDYNKFKYKLVKKGGQSRDFKESIDLLNISRITIPTYLVKKPNISLEGNYDFKHFKLYFSDIGILLNKARISKVEIIKGNFSFLGWITENFVAIHLKYHYQKLFYWYKEPFEVDFLIKNGDNIIPIEVKSGRNKRSKSLNHYISKINPIKTIILSKNNFNFKKDGTFTIPIYATFLVNKI